MVKSILWPSQYPFTNYRKSKNPKNRRGTVQWIPVIIEEVGRTLHFRTAAHHQTIQAVGIQHLRIHGTGDRIFWKNRWFFRGSGFSMPGPNRYGCWVLNTHLTHLRPSHASDASKKWGLRNGGPKTNNPIYWPCFMGKPVIRECTD